MTNDIDTRDAIIADLSARLAAAEERNADYEADFRATLAEACGEDDRQHCACVPHLRRRIAALEAEVARLNEELQAEKKSATENIGSWQIIAGEWGAKCHHLQVEVEQLKAHNAAARQLLDMMWNRADDWHGPQASSHFRSEIAEKIKDLEGRGDHCTDEWGCPVCGDPAYHCHHDED